MIVRDNEDTIEACLDSIYPWVDEIIVVDTGSKDRTPEICRRFGARMFEFPWCDDFSAARNESLRHATGDWVFWMDSDDTIPQEQGQQLRALVYGDHEQDCMGYVMQVHCKSSEPGQLTIVDHVKVFRNLPDLRFEHRIHEQILPSIRRAGGNVAFTDIFVIHSGSDPTPEIRKRKLERDFRILALDEADRPDHPFVLFNLGMTHEDAGQYGEAERCLRRCIAVSGDGESHLAKTYSLLVNTLKSLERIGEAIEISDAALALYPGDKELLFRKATLLLGIGRFEEAAAAFEMLLSESVDRTFKSFDPSIIGYKAHHNLALAYQHLGENDVAARQWLEAIRLCPQFGFGWLCLVRHYLKIGHADTAIQLAGRMRSVLGHAADSAIAAAICHESKGEIQEAQISLETAFVATGDTTCLDELGRILFESEHFADCVLVLERLLSLQPENAAASQNLGASLRATGSLLESIEPLQRSLELRPDSPMASLLLAAVFKSLQRLDAAGEVLEEAMRRAPENLELKAALSSLD